ncbi:hypothetical protein GE09DRAFT_1273182, partial [Coniochaeta sp. 2T2.1]
DLLSRLLFPLPIFVFPHTSPHNTIIHNSHLPLTVLFPPTRYQQNTTLPTPTGMSFSNVLAWVKASLKSKKDDKNKEEPAPESLSTPPPRPSLLDIVTAGKREFPPHPAAPPSGLQVVLEKMDEICDRARATNKELQCMRNWYEVVLTEYEASYLWKEDRAYSWDDTIKETRAELTETKGKIEKYVAELEALEKEHRELTEEGARWLMDRFWLRRGDWSEP